MPQSLGQMFCWPSTRQRLFLADAKGLLDGRIRKGTVLDLIVGNWCHSLHGIDFFQMPTTLLSQVDASVGGKLGIDFWDIKNSIGLFQDPLAVLIDPAFINTLPYEELRSGFAEIIKHSLIEDAENKEKK